MATFPTAIKPNRDELSNQRERQHDAEGGREIVHDLMNHLTVIDLCAFQVRSTVNPFTLAALERAVEGALRSANGCPLRSTQRQQSPARNNRRITGTNGATG